MIISNFLITDHHRSTHVLLVHLIMVLHSQLKVNVRAVLVRLIPGLLLNYYMTVENKTLLCLFSLLHRG